MDKKINFFTKFVACIIILLARCDDYLDRMPDDKVNEQEVFTRYDYVNQLVTDLYAGAKSANKPLLFFNHFGASSITDEATGSSHEAAIPHQFHIGNYGPSQGMPDRSSVG